MLLDLSHRSLPTILCSLVFITSGIYAMDNEKKLIDNRLAKALASQDATLFDDRKQLHLVSIQKALNNAPLEILVDTYKALLEATEHAIKRIRMNFEHYAGYPEHKATSQKMNYIPIRENLLHYLKEQYTKQATTKPICTIHPVDALIMLRYTLTIPNKQIFLVVPDGREGAYRCPTCELPDQLITLYRNLREEEEKSLVTSQQQEHNNSIVLSKRSSTNPEKLLPETVLNTSETIDLIENVGIVKNAWDPSRMLATLEKLRDSIKKLPYTPIDTRQQGTIAIEDDAKDDTLCARLVDTATLAAKATNETELKNRLADINTIISKLSENAMRQLPTQFKALSISSRDNTTTTTTTMTTVITNTTANTTTNTKLVPVTKNTKTISTASAYDQQNTKPQTIAPQPVLNLVERTVLKNRVDNVLPALSQPAMMLDVLENLQHWINMFDHHIHVGTHQEATIAVNDDVASAIIQLQESATLATEATNELALACNLANINAIISKLSENATTKISFDDTAVIAPLTSNISNTTTSTTTTTMASVTSTNTETVPVNARTISIAPVIDLSTLKDQIESLEYSAPKILEESLRGIRKNINTICAQHDITSIDINRLKPSTAASSSSSNNVVRTAKSSTSIDAIQAKNSSLIRQLRERVQKLEVAGSREERMKHIAAFYATLDSLQENAITLLDEHNVKEYLSQYYDPHQYPL